MAKFINKITGRTQRTAHKRGEWLKARPKSADREGFVSALLVILAGLAIIGWLQ